MFYDICDTCKNMRALCTCDSGITIWGDDTITITDGTSSNTISIGAPSYGVHLTDDQISEIADRVAEIVSEKILERIVEKLLIGEDD